MSTNQVTAADVLTYAEDLIVKSFAQGWFARTQSSAKVSALSDQAVSWCPFRAIQRTAYTFGASAATRRAAVVALQREVGGALSPWADAPGRTKDEVIEAMRRARRGIGATR